MPKPIKNEKQFQVTESSGLVDGLRLLEVVWPIEACRPSLRWLRDQQKHRAIPFVKLGRLVYFDPDKVREAFALKTVGGPRN